MGAPKDKRKWQWARQEPVVSLSFPSKVLQLAQQIPENPTGLAREERELLYVMQRIPARVVRVVLSELQLITVGMMNNQLAA